MWKLIDRSEELLAVAFLGATVFSVLAGATGRAIGHPFPMGAEIAQLCLIWSCMLGADLVIKRGEHIRISALPDALPPAGRRLLALICLLSIAAFLAYCTYLGWTLAISNWARPMGASGLSYGWVTLAFPVGCLLMLISLARRVLRHGVTYSIEPEVRSGEQLL